MTDTKITDFPPHELARIKQEREDNPEMELHPTVTEFLDGIEKRRLDLEQIGVTLADVEAETVEWFWEGRIPYGKLTIIDGDPGTSKSLLTTDLTARITRGRAFPDGTPCEPSGVVMLAAEDGIADTIRPRLDAAGGDPAMVRVLNTLPDGKGGERGVTIPEDIPAIEKAVEQIGAKLVIVDPLMGVLSPTVNSNNDQAVRGALNPLLAMAHRTGVAVVVVRHLNKSGGGSAMYRGGGSIGITGIVRSAFVVGENPDDENERILAHYKHNLSKGAASLSYTVRTAANGAARIEWTGESLHTASDLLNVPTDPEEKSALDEAKEWLTDELKDRPMWAKTVQDNARRAGISESTLKRAKSALKVKSERETEGWSWSIPSTKRASG